MSAADLDEGADLTWPEPTTPMHQPRRWVFAAVGLLAAVGFAALAWWLWDLGVVRGAPLPDRPDLEFAEFSGEYVALSVAAGTVAAVALLDAVRNAVLATRAR